MSSAAILGPGGAIAQRLRNYEARPQQLEMAQAVTDAIAARRHLMVEAGTGVGKSFAYLVPAILAAADHPKLRVVVSTHTINLQVCCTFLNRQSVLTHLQPLHRMLANYRVSRE